MPAVSSVANKNPTARLVRADARMESEEYGAIVLSLFEKSGIGLAVLDPALRVRAVNDVFIEQCGRPREVVSGHSLLAFLHVSVRQDLLRQFEWLVQGRRSRAAGHPLAARFDGTGVAGQLTAFTVPDSDGQVRMIVVQFAPERVPESVSATGESQKLNTLTARILEGVAAGDPTLRLAARHFLSRQGIEYHVSILLRRFQVPNRTALAAKAYSMGVFRTGCWPPRVHPEYIQD